MSDLLQSLEPRREAMGPGAVLLRGHALPAEAEILAALQAITAQAPFRRMTTPGGFLMSVAMTNCGAAGWVTDRTGYRYARCDPETGQRWPALPAAFLALATQAAAEASYPDFRPDSCLINRYEAGARLSLHQDRNERDLAHPIVVRIPRAAGDIPVRRGESHGPGTPLSAAPWRCRGLGRPLASVFHGVAELKAGEHETLGRMRINLTFRVAL